MLAIVGYDPKLDDTQQDWIECFRLSRVERVCGLNKDGETEIIWVTRAGSMYRNRSSSTWKKIRDASFVSSESLTSIIAKKSIYRMILRVQQPAEYVVGVM